MSRCLQKSNLKFDVNMDKLTPKIIKTERENPSNGSKTSRFLKIDKIADKISCIPSSEKPQEICRLCGKSGFDYRPIFDDDNLFIAEKISRCLPIVVLSNDGLPSHICSKCLRSLNASYKLILTSIKMDSRLRHLLNEFNEKSSSIIFTDVNKYSLTNKSNYDDVSLTHTEKLNFTAIYNGPMNCEMCEKYFVDMNEFDRHVETEHLLPWACNFCEKSFDSSENLIEHKESMHAGNISICNVCIDTQELNHDLSLSTENNCPEEKQVKKINHFLSEKKKFCKQNSPKNDANVESNERKKNTKLLAMCDICKIAFGNDELLTAHRRIHQKKILRCCICQIDVMSIYELFIHKREKHNIYKRVQLKFVCDICGKFFSNNWQWLNHKRKNDCKIPKVRSNESSHTCKYCNNNFTTNCKLIRHLRKHKDEMLKDPSVTIYRCVACPKIFVDQEFYQQHRNVHDPECWDKFKCGLCDRSFRDKRRLREHQLSIHENFKPHQCDVCDKKFHRLSNMRVHRKKHFGHKCDHCDETFEKLRMLTEHIKSVHNLESNIKQVPKKQKSSGCFVCRFCGKKLATYHSVLDHEHIHTGEKPYNCKICDKTFRTYTAMWAHTQRHVKGIFICEHCGKSFSYKQNLTTHIQVHVPMESRRHRCSKCGKYFQRKSHLNIHMRIHDGVRPYTCDICQFSFTQLGDMKRHRARHAKGELNSKNSRTKPVKNFSNEEDKKLVRHQNLLV